MSNENVFVMLFFFIFLCKNNGNTKSSTQYLEPNSFGATISSKFVEGLRDDKTSGTKHGPSSVNELICLISISRTSKMSLY